MSAERERLALEDRRLALFSKTMQLKRQNRRIVNLLKQSALF